MIEDLDHRNCYHNVGLDTRNRNTFVPAITNESLRAYEEGKRANHPQTFMQWWTGTGKWEPAQTRQELAQAAWEAAKQ